MIKLRIIAWFVLINFLTVTLFPTLTFALTSGPTSPDFSSFEPIETTDMVNLNTGDFTYSIPLLEVPGPEGGYPMALSYHAGISPEEEASWVGLGWNLNPGAISRMVNGFPDDMNRSTNLVHDVWVGGETNTSTVTVGYGSSYLGVGVGITYANDTYKGIGIGMDLSLGLRLSDYASLGITVGNSPYGERHAGLGLSVHSPGAGANAAFYVGIQTSSEQDGLTAVGGVGIGVTGGGNGSPHASLLGASISSNGKKTNFSNSVGGISGSANNSHADDVSVSSSGWNWDIFSWYGIYVGIGASHTRYFLDKIDQTPVYGSLYGASIGGDYWNVSYDCYAMPESVHSYENKPDESLGGSLPSYDHYMVSGQGIGGAIQPYIYEPGALFRKGSVPFYYGSGFNKFYNRVGFRFVYDFSNSFTRNNVNEVYNDIDSYVSNVSATIGIDNKPYDAQNFEDFNKSTGQLAGSKHVEWFTNRQIADYSANVTNGAGNGLNGFVPSLDQRTEYFQNTGVYGQDTPDNIGGFLVTNESGVSYHYSIPVYNFNDVTKYTNNLKGDYSRTITKSLPYAYNWLLTAITGPDYVDRFPYGQVDPNDWGYWVKMEYGKWTDKYSWRTPNDGAGEKDIVSSTRVYTGGSKEIYYLDAVRTRSHTALFVKDLRLDAKGVTDENGGGFGVVKDAGGIVDLPAASLKLNRVLLFTNRMLATQLALINNTNNATSVGFSSVTELKGKGNLLKHQYQNGVNTLVLHQGDKILDEEDLNDAVTKISKAAIRQYQFNYTYDLCKGVPNSFDLNYNASPQDIVKPDNSTTGKLTLQSITTVGFNGIKTIPPTSFDYALKEVAYQRYASDVWGNYKSDFTTDGTDRFNTTQVTTQESAKYKHAWSLSTIHTSMGADINIDYESDTYNNNVLTGFKNFAIKSIQPSSNDITCELFSNEKLSNIRELEVGKHVKIYLQIDRRNLGISNFQDYRADNLLDPPTTLGLDLTITSVNSISNTITLASDNYTNLFRLNELNQTFYTLINSVNDYNVWKWDLTFGNIVVQRVADYMEFGGDIRVKSIALKSDLTECITNYTYLNGTTSMDPLDICLHSAHNYNYITPVLDAYYNGIYQYYSDIIANTSFIPPAEVLYSSVIVQDKIRHYNASNDYTEIAGEGSVKYDFTVFDNSMIGRSEGAVNTLADHSIQRTVTMKDYRNRVGLLKKVTNYDGLEATGNVLSTKENSYLHNLADYETQLKDRFANQGRVDQVFFEKKILNAKNNLLITKIEEHPVVQTSVVNYDSKKGTTESRILAYDFYSGVPAASWMKDAWGNEFISETVPAYKVYAGMGLKVNDPAHKNMLTQGASSAVYKVAPNKANPVKVSDYDKTGLMSAAAQTWTTGLSVRLQDYQYGTGIIYQNNPNSGNGLVWRKEAAYEWIGNDNVALNNDGTYTYAQFTPFDFNTVTNNSSSWQKNGSVGIVDVFSHLHESYDLNGNASAVLMDPALQYLTATASFAKRNEIAYSGAEFYDYYASPNLSFTNKLLEGNVTLGNGIITPPDPNKAHTGVRSLMVAQNQEGFTYSFTPENNRKFKASTWLYLPGSAEGEGVDELTNARLVYRLKGTNAILNKPGEGYRSLERKARSFYLLELTIDPSLVRHSDGTYPEIEVVCVSLGADRSLYFDDFRVAPMESGMTSYVYDLDKGLLTHILDADNFYTRFEYDELGRLRASYREVFRTVEKKVSEQRIHYSNQ